MADFDLYYWPLPFRGQFVRAILAYGGKTWNEHDSVDNAALMARPPADQPVPFMGPPVLIDTASGFALSQMAAIAIYLGEELNLVPASAQARALSAKVVNDANDVIDELTLNGGQQMWTQEKWSAFVPRLQRWMQIFEALGSRHAMTADSGYLLGTPDPGVADIVTATLWATMADRFPPIATLLERTVPAVAGLTRRVQSLPPLAALRQRTFQAHGDAYCGGDIEASLRRVLH